MLALRRIRQPKENQGRAGRRRVKRKRSPKFLRGRKGRVERPTPSPSPGRIESPSKPGRVRTPSPGKEERKPRRVIDKSPAARQAFLQSLTKEELASRFHRDPRRTPAKPKPRVQQPSKTARVEGPSKTKRVQEPSRVERVSKERVSKVQPRVRKKRKSKGPSYTSTSLNV